MGNLFTLCGACNWLQTKIHIHIYFTNLNLSHMKSVQYCSSENKHNNPNGFLLCFIIDLMFTFIHYSRLKYGIVIGLYHLCCEISSSSNTAVMTDSGEITCLNWTQVTLTSPRYAKYKYTGFATSRNLHLCEKDFLALWLFWIRVICSSCRGLPMSSGE